MNIRTVTDQMGRRVEVPRFPQRVISLVPSQTELICDLGGAPLLCGVTSFCIHPASTTAAIRKIGGTKQFRFELIESLQPDLILGNKEENYPEGIYRLAERFPVWMSDIVYLQDALQMMLEIGKLLQLETAAEQMTQDIRRKFEALKQEIIPKKNIRTAYLIWKDPWMAAANNTFIHQMMEAAGMSNVFSGLDRYPEFSLEELAALQPELILLSSEPYAFNRQHLEALQLQFPQTRIALADGECFSWYGSHLQKSPDYFLQLRLEQGF